MNRREFIKKIGQIMGGLALIIFFKPKYGRPFDYLFPAGVNVGKLIPPGMHSKEYAEVYLDGLENGEMSPEEYVERIESHLNEVAHSNNRLARYSRPDIGGKQAVAEYNKMLSDIMEARMATRK